LKLAVVLVGDAKVLDHPPADPTSPYTDANNILIHTTVDNSLFPYPKSLEGHSVESPKPTLPAQVFTISATVDAAGYADGLVLGDAPRSFIARTISAGVIDLPAYGNDRIAGGGGDLTTRDPGVAGSWFVPRKLNVRASYLEGLPSFARIESAYPSPDRQNALSWTGEGLIAPQEYWTLIPEERTNNRKLFWAGVLLGLAGTCAVAAIQVLASSPSRVR
jgi:hypothetical protein